MNKITLYLTILAGLVAMNAFPASNNHSEDSLYLGYDRVVVTESVFNKSPEKDIKKALYGKIRGLHVEQGVGSSANNNASLKLYGKSPLILVDGFVRSNLSELTSIEIESISVLRSEERRVGKECRARWCPNH